VEVVKSQAAPRRVVLAVENVSREK
jgi:hypothetical protein